ncbi:MAG: response regulator [Patescibacteria group bacterium]
MAKKILVIDDDDAIQQVIKSALVSEGYEVRIADDGKEGLKVVKEFQPDLIILDIIMPVMDGLGFLKENKNRSIPVIILTSLGKDDNEQKFIDLGARHFLQKSIVHVDDIKQKISDVLKEESK